MGSLVVTAIASPAGAPAPPPGADSPRRWTLPALVGLGVALACSLFVFVQMRPDLLLANTTPAGGDMGAHVWGPAFLRDHLLPQGRLSGWTPDWYAGFAVYQYYMVVPSLAIVALNAGFQPLIGVPLGALLIGLTVFFTKDSAHNAKLRLASVIVALGLISVPYGIAFKLVSVAGLVAFPLMGWAMARLARAPEPVPAFTAMAATIFLFDTNFSITGGNIASTLAGEFAFSISLALTLLAIGLAARGMDTGRWRAPAAATIALICLCHIIPVFFAIVALVSLVVMGRSVPRLWPVATAIGLALIPVALADGTSRAVSALSILATVLVLGAVIVTEPEVRARARWLVIVGPTAVLLACFWLLPFVARKPYFNDMGWERLTEFGPKMLTVPMKVALPVAVIGLILSVATRERVGLVFSTTALVSAAAVVNLPDGALWNERLLPFYYLSVYMVAAVAVALVARYAATAVSEDFARPHGRTIISASIAGLLATLIAVGMPLRVLPFGVTRDDTTWRWAVFTSHARSFLPSWTAWNYSGYERKPAFREYHDVVATMAELGQTEGCGRAMWEYSKDLDRYGTPMALMLLPFWTDSCIGSMEGLYFESSATTPFHFLNQSTLSDAPSRAQRDLPYQGFDIERGVGQLQVMGVKYYLAQSDSAIAAARDSGALKEVGESQPFVIFEVAGSELVEGLSVEPVVTSGQTAPDAGAASTRFDVGWLGQAVQFYNNPDGYEAIPAEDGPANWERVGTLLPDDGTPVEAAVVSDIVADTSSISFSVNKVGTPVLVKASFFPNWKADGADGPWRIGPNLMAVVPTETNVTLSYGRTGIDWLGTLATLAGLAGLGLLARRDRRSSSQPEQVETREEPANYWGDELAELSDNSSADRPLVSAGVGLTSAETNGHVPPEGDESNGAGPHQDGEPAPAPVDTRLSTEVSRDMPRSS